MAIRKDQHKVGTPKRPRGQQTGFAGNPDQNPSSNVALPANVAAVISTPPPFPTC